MNKEDVVQMRLWRGASKWVALWLMLSVLTLLHAGALIAALYDVPIAKVSLSPSLNIQPACNVDSRCVTVSFHAGHHVSAWPLAV
jgi:hypothetical protein